MTPEQIGLVKLTFIEAMSARQKLGRLFYGRLFAIAPETRSLFKSDMDSQAAKLMDTLALAIGMLRDRPMLISLQSLAQRHADCGVKDEHYAKVGEALVWTLEQALGPAFTPQAREAWTALYATVSTVMIEASQATRDAHPAAVA